MRPISKKELMMKFAEMIATRSTCKRLQVGTVITDWTMRSIRSYGYNGNYRGGPNTCDRSTPGNCGCIHSECNALINATERGSGLVLK